MGGMKEVVGEVDKEGNGRDEGGGWMRRRKEELGQGINCSPI